MEAVAVVVMICVGVYYLFKHTTDRGTNTVRAYIYLCAINDGATAEEANKLAKVDAAYLPKLTIRDAQEHVQSLYGGKQLPMIAEATRLGFMQR